MHGCISVFSVMLVADPNFVTLFQQVVFLFCRPRSLSFHRKANFFVTCRVQIHTILPNDCFVQIRVNAQLFVTFK